MKTLLKNGIIVTLNPHDEIIHGDLLIENNKIAQIATEISSENVDNVIELDHQFVIPGLIQAHTHLCQTLYRGYADDLALLDWLKNKIWPMEFCHTAKSIRSSAQISLSEMQLLGTTSILDMATINHTNSLLEEVAFSKMRYVGGKCFMDLKGSSGPLYEPLEDSLAETKELLTEWTNKNELIHYALCPRFAVSCSDEMMNICAELQQQYDLIIHTHASESLEEIQVIKDRTGLLNIEYFHKLGILNQKTIMVHGVHVTPEELQMMLQSKTPVVHCPSSNLKLASGIAPVEDYVNQGLTVGVGADGAPCNNTMDPFLEMRLLALLQKPKFGPEALPAKTALKLSTLGGAKVLGLEKEIGSLEVGKMADIVTVDRSHPSVATIENPYSALVYSCSGRDVKNVFINGKLIVKNKEHQLYDTNEVIANAKNEIKQLINRIESL